MGLLDKLFTTSKEEEFKNKLAAAENGDIASQFHVGQMYDGGYGVKQDYSKASYWYQKAAEAGNMDAQKSLAIMYYHGEGVFQDISKAMYWWEQAAKKGDMESQHYLGMQYIQMNDLDNAQYWERKAAAQGHEGAKKNSTMITGIKLGILVPADN